ncbi:Suppressor of G2 allele of SKP1 [Gurleya vavrai]
MSDKDSQKKESMQDPRYAQFYSNDSDSSVDNNSLESLFYKFYKNASDDAKKAMNKSFLESEGTVLSSNWSEVKSKKVDLMDDNSEVVRLGEDEIKNHNCNRNLNAVEIKEKSHETKNKKIDEKNEVRKEIKNEIKTHKNNDVKNEIKTHINVGVKNEAREQLKNKVYEKKNNSSTAHKNNDIKKINYKKNDVNSHRKDDINSVIENELKKEIYEYNFNYSIDNKEDISFLNYILSNENMKVLEKAKICHTSRNEFLDEDIEPIKIREHDIIEIKATRDKILSVKNITKNDNKNLYIKRVNNDEKSITAEETRDNREFNNKSIIEEKYDEEKIKEILNPHLKEIAEITDIDVFDKNKKNVE